ncbi:MAG: UDP-N-acetylmuramoyl-L-alanine--D-glutamate ligase [Desulfobulbus oligotrophicus]|jgi:UDP-N-acetylmuramoylalanine--D-glutamate ligase|nr:UDP-N-acetylmuramoyl-L-alanine--D-glutamate ligase [Desulfobulbus oligotrophicus]
MDIQPGTQALIIGLGAAGLSTVRYLTAMGVRVKVSDQRKIDQIEPATIDLLRSAGIALETGGHSLDQLTGMDVVIPGPGVPLDVPVLQAARKQGLPVLGELALAAGRFSSPVIAITGSNGKTTVTGLLGHLLQAAGKHPFVGGNIGTPLLDYFAAPEAYDVVVLELSSFQLDLAGAFRPDTALLLNISPDHLDRHGSLAAYRSAKMRIFANQIQGDTAILGADDPVVAHACICSGVNRYMFGRDPVCAARIVDDNILLRLEQNGNSRQEEYRLSRTNLFSSVNQLNAAAALLAAAVHGCRYEDLARGLATFIPPPHRMAEVAVIDDVRFINDSKATNIGALAAALNSCPAPVVLIAGGRDKASDFTLLKETVARRVKRLILIGEAADAMEAALGSAVGTERAKTMEDAVRRAKAVAGSGDIVLLAPGCASFDMFSGYAERGTVYEQHVLRLSRECGVNVCG